MEQLGSGFDAYDRDRIAGSARYVPQIDTQRVAGAAVAVDAQSDLSGAAGDAGGDVQDPVAEGVDLGSGQAGVLGEPDQFGPGHQICCGQKYFQPCRVRIGVVAGQVAQSGGLGLADPLLDPGVLAVA